MAICDGPGRNGLGPERDSVLGLYPVPTVPHSPSTCGLRRRSSRRRRRRRCRRQNGLNQPDFQALSASSGVELALPRPRAPPRSHHDARRWFPRQIASPSLTFDDGGIYFATCFSSMAWLIFCPTALSSHVSLKYSGPGSFNGAWIGATKGNFLLAFVIDK